MSLEDYLKKQGYKDPKDDGKPLWTGPDGEGEQGGLTFSLLSRFLTCRERFRLLVVKGLKGRNRWNHRTGYGNMWHVCEEAIAGGPPQRVYSEGQWRDYWHVKLRDHAREMARQYPFQQEEILKWYNVCKVQFPLYIDYWQAHTDVTAKKPIFAEKVFDVLYTLPSGRKVRLRGKWDSVDLLNDAIWLQENKTKGEVDQIQLCRQLSFDLQTMMYLTALTTYQVSPGQYHLGGEGLPRSLPIAGIRYNVIRRPLSGGKGTIVRHKPTKKNPKGESEESYYGRLAAYIKAEPDTYFFRWNVPVTTAALQRFRQRCLDPLLESLWDWWEWIRHSKDPFGPSEQGTKNCWHWQHPFGVRNMLDEGGATDLDAYLENGTEVGLQRWQTLFPELEGCTGP